MKLAVGCRVGWCLNPAVRNGWCYTHLHQHPIPPPTSHVRIVHRESARVAAFFDSIPPIPNLLEGDPE